MKRMLPLLLVWFGAAALRAGPLPFVNGTQNGALVWTNEIPDATYRVLGLVNSGDYHATWQQAQGLQMPTNGELRVPAPTEFGVLRLTHLPPAGMALVEAGEVVRGSGEAAEEMPIHTNFIDSFYVDRIEVPFALWDRVRRWGLTNGYTDLPPGDSGWIQSPPAPNSASNHPVVNINWYDALKWCNARSEAEGLDPAIRMPFTADVFRTGEIDNPVLDLLAMGYRLPTEAEWEKAARGGPVLNHYPWPSLGGRPADHLDATRANYVSSADLYEAGTTPAGWYNGSQWIVVGFIRFPGRDMANGYGLYDMAGNVSEWCWDWYDGAYYDNRVYENPTGPDSSIFGRVVRGGDWYSDANWLRCAARAYDGAYELRNYRGFRCVRRASVISGP